MRYHFFFCLFMNFAILFLSHSTKFLFTLHECCFVKLLFGVLYLKIRVKNINSNLTVSNVVRVGSDSS